LAALREYSRLIAAEPHFAVLYTLRGEAYYALNDLPKAVNGYTSAIKLDDSRTRPISAGVWHSAEWGGWMKPLRI